MIFVIYAQATGKIMECGRSPAPPKIGADYGWVEVAEFRVDYDVTHRVIGGEVSEIPAEEVLAASAPRALSRLRVRRDLLLRSTYDPVRANPDRWGLLSTEQQAQALAYRQALLAWPEVEPDVHNPTEPAMPAFLA